MPTSHDGKPRNKARRMKYQIEMQGTKPKVISPRAARRRVLRQLTQKAAAAQIELAKTLRRLGIRWRDVEVKVGGDFRKINPEWLKAYYQERGGILPPEKEAA